MIRILSCGWLIVAAQGVMGGVTMSDKDSADPLVRARLLRCVHSSLPRLSSTIYVV
jgi:hypothetical protein